MPLSTSEAQSLAKKYNTTPDKVVSLSKGSDAKYTDRVLANAVKAGTLNPKVSAPAPAAAPAPTAGGVVPIPATGSPLDKYVEKASKALTPGFKTAISDITQAGQTVATKYEEMAKSVKDTEPLVRQTYANLAVELGAEEKTETAAALQTGEMGIGQARADLAAGGTSTAGSEAAGGAFRAPLTIAEQQRSANIAQITDKYKVNRQTLESNLNADIASIEKEANTYSLQGATELANVTKQIASLKLDFQDKVNALAKEQYQFDVQIQRDIDKQKDEDRKFALQQQKADQAEANATARLKLQMEHDDAIAQKTMQAQNLKIATDTRNQLYNGQIDWGTAFNIIQNNTGADNDAVDRILGVPAGYKGPGWQWFAERGG